MRRESLTRAALILAIALAATRAPAQIAGGIPNAPQLPDNAGAALQSGGQMTPEQIRDIYWLRTLQARGRRGGVRTGFPQFVPYGPTGFMGFPTFPGQTAQQPQAASKAEQKRAAREERKRVAREKAEAKKAAAEKAKAEAKAKAKAKNKP